MVVLKLAHMEALLKKAGAMRTSRGSLEALRDVLEKQALEIGGKAKAFAEHAGRITIKKTDIILTQNQTDDKP